MVIHGRFGQTTRRMANFNNVGDSASRLTAVGLGIGFLVGSASQWRESLSAKMAIKIGAIAAYFAAGGAAIGALAEVIRGLH